MSGDGESEQECKEGCLVPSNVVLVNYNFN